MMLLSYEFVFLSLMQCVTCGGGPDRYPAVHPATPPHILLPQLQQWTVEIGSLLVLLTATAALHYTMDFHSPFPMLTGGPSAHNPLLNFALVLAGTVGAYATVRTVCSVASSRIPESVKADCRTRSGAVAAFVLAIPCSILAVMGADVVAQNKIVIWLGRNWERQGKQDVMWCLRLFVLLAAWQFSFGILVFMFSKLWSLVWLCFRSLAGAGSGVETKNVSKGDVGTVPGSDSDLVGDVGVMMGASKGTPCIN